MPSNRIPIAVVKAGDLKEVNQRIAAGAPVNERVLRVGSLDDDYTPLGIAAREGHPDLVWVLLAADPHGLTGFSTAASVPLRTSSVRLRQ